MKKIKDLSDPKTMEVTRLSAENKDKLQRIFDLFDELFSDSDGADYISRYSVETLWKILREQLYETHGDLLFEVHAQWKQGNKNK